MSRSLGWRTRQFGRFLEWQPGIQSVYCSCLFGGDIHRCGILVGYFPVSSPLSGKTILEMDLVGGWLAC